jgi:hypothetical protein
MALSRAYSSRSSFKNAAHFASSGRSKQMTLMSSRRSEAESQACFVAFSRLSWSNTMPVRSSPKSSVTAIGRMRSALFPSDEPLKWGSDRTFAPDAQCVARRIHARQITTARKWLERFLIRLVAGPPDRPFATILGTPQSIERDAFHKKQNLTVDEHPPGGETAVSGARSNTPDPSRIDAWHANYRRLAQIGSKVRQIRADAGVGFCERTS